MWIVESARIGKGFKDMYKVSGIDVYIKDKLPENIDPEFVFKYINARIPFHLTTGVDIIYIGQFDMFKEKQVNAIFQDGAIYVTTLKSFQKSKCRVSGKIGLYEMKKIESFEIDDFDDLAIIKKLFTDKK